MSKHLKVRMPLRANVRTTPIPDGLVLGELKVVSGTPVHKAGEYKVLCYCGVCKKPRWLGATRIRLGQLRTCSRRCGMSLHKQQNSLDLAGQQIAGVLVTRTERVSSRVYYRYTCTKCRRPGRALRQSLLARRKACLFCEHSGKGLADVSEVNRKKEFAVGSEHGAYKVLRHLVRDKAARVSCQHGLISVQTLSNLRRRPSCCKGRHLVNGVTLSIAELRRVFGVSKNMLKYHRTVHGRTADDVVRLVASGQLRKAAKVETKP